MIIKNGLVFTENGSFEALHISTRDDLITGIYSHIPKENDEIFDAAGCLVLPGLTDIHFHGCNGYDFCQGNKEAFDAITSFELTQGVTSVCPATMTLPFETLSDIFKNAAAYRRAQKMGEGRTDTADFVGIHMEGPFINAHKKGAQNAAYVQKPSVEKLRSWQRDAEGMIRLISLAPEIPGALSCIKECNNEFHFSIAHTEADYDTSMNAFVAGANHVTHLYNAMPPFLHRAPGVIGAAFDSDKAFVELICDGIHIAPSAVRATFHLFGDDRIILISDSMEAAGMPDGTYSLGGLKVNVKGKLASLSDGTIAGGAASLYQCMLTAVSMGIPLESAVKAATINPCRSIGIDTVYGSIKENKKAHFLILKKEDLSIKAVIKGQSRLAFL